MVNTLTIVTTGELLLPMLFEIPKLACPQLVENGFQKVVSIVPASEHNNLQKVTLQFRIDNATQEDFMQVLIVWFPDPTWLGLGIRLAGPWSHYLAWGMGDAAVLNNRTPLRLKGQIPYYCRATEHCAKLHSDDVINSLKAELN